MKTYLAIVGVVCGVFAVVLLVRRIHLYVVGVRAMGVFSKWELRGVRQPAHHPVVRFKAQDGKEYELTSMSGRRPQPKIKTVYHVVYPLASPEKGLVYSFMSYWAAPLIFFLFSVMSFFTCQRITE
jgi:hypothetical protein